MELKGPIVVAGTEPVEWFACFAPPERRLVPFEPQFEYQVLVAAAVACPVLDRKRAALVPLLEVVSFESPALKFFDASEEAIVAAGPTLQVVEPFACQVLEGIGNNIILNTFGPIKNTNLLEVVERQPPAERVVEQFDFPASLVGLIVAHSALFAVRFECRELQ